MKGVFYMALKRSRETVIADILEFCIGGACKTTIVYKTNMNFRIATIYLDKLINIGLLQIVNGDKTIYKTTERGREVLRGLKCIQKEIPQLCSQAR